MYVEGRLKTRKWQDKDGKDVYTTEIVAENMQLLGGREGGSYGGGQSGSSDEGFSRGGDNGEAPARAAAPRPAPAATGSRPAASLEDMDDDIPF